MTVGKIDKRTAVLFAVGVGVILILKFGVYNDHTVDVVSPTESIPMAEKRLDRLRRIAATVPGKETVLKQVSAELREREKGLLKGDTAPQAQAELLTAIRRIGSANGIDARGVETMNVRALGKDYGEVLVVVTFSCAIEQLVNFLAALANEPEILATNEIHVVSANNKQKTIQVRLSVSGVVMKKLVPEKKGVAAF
jgi:hypothetical protein